MSVVAGVLILLGLAVITVGVVGLARMPDVLTALHASSKVVVVGAFAIIAASFATGDAAIIGKGILIAAVLAVTTPVGAHAIARAAYREGAGDAKGGRDAAGEGDGARGDGAVPPGAV